MPYNQIQIVVIISVQDEVISRGRAYGLQIIVMIAEGFSYFFGNYSSNYNMI